MSRGHLSMKRSVVMVALVILAIVGATYFLPARDGEGSPRRGPDEPGTGLAAARRDFNEHAAIATLRMLISAQAHFQATARADESRNGVGEYGSFAEMSGALEVRGGTLFDPPALSAAFRNVADGCAERNGYRFRIYLPGAKGIAVPERDRGGFDAGRLDADLAERLWCAYAWPVDGGSRTFFTNQDGEILATSGYAGDNEPPPHAAFQDTSGLAAPTVIDLPEGRRVGADRQEWKQAG